VSETFATERQRNKLVAVVAVGGGGTRIVEELVLGGEGLQRRFVAVDRYSPHFNASSCPRKVSVDVVARGFYDGGDLKMSRDAARRTADAILVASGPPDLGIVVATLGGGMGSGAGPVVAGLLGQAGVPTVAVVSTPFAFEGVRQRNRALDGLKAFQDAANVTLWVPYERVHLGLPRGSATTVYQAFQEADRVMACAVAGLLDLAIPTEPHSLHESPRMLGKALADRRLARLASAWATVFAMR
jgi:cell division protein FtsZ